MDLLEGKSIAFDDPSWSILTASPQRLPARMGRGASVVDSLVAPGCTVDGSVINSVLGPGAVVDAGAAVTDSVLLDRVEVKQGATVTRTILDTGAVIKKGAQVGAVHGDLTLVGMGATVRAGEQVAAGSRVGGQDETV